MCLESEGAAQGREKPAGQQSSGLMVRSGKEHCREFTYWLKKGALGIFCCFSTSELVQDYSFWRSHSGSAVMNLTSIHEDVGLTPGPAQ